MYKIYSIAAIRSALKYANKAHNDGTFQEKYLAEGWAYWRSASGKLVSNSEGFLLNPLKFNGWNLKFLGPPGNGDPY